MARFGDAYQDLCDVQKKLKSLVIQSTTESTVGAASCAKQILEIEMFKREMRGIARLRPVERMANLKRLASPSSSPVEIHATAEPTPEPKQS